MDCAFNWEYNSPINELTQGTEHTQQLRTYLSFVASTSEAIQELLQKILSSYERSLLILKRSGSPTETKTKGETGLILDGYCRRSQPTWPVQVKVSVENRFEGPTDDGYSWRKYGQKDILGAKYLRYYFRCTYENTRRCWAKKQMQQSDYDPLVVEIVYRGRHTCELATNSALQATSPEKEAPNSALKQHHQRKKLLILQLQAASPEKEAPNSALQAASPEKEASHHSVIVGGSSQPIVSPTTPESNYFSVSSCQMNGLETVPNLSHSESYPSDTGIFLKLRHSDSDRTDTLSAKTSTTSSSIGGEFTRPNFSIWSKRHPQTQDNILQKEDKDE